MKTSAVNHPQEKSLAKWCLDLWSLWHCNSHLQWKN